MKLASFHIYDTNDIKKFFKDHNVVSMSIRQGFTTPGGSVIDPMLYFMYDDRKSDAHYQVAMFNEEDYANLKDLQIAINLFCAKYAIEKINTYQNDHHKLITIITYKTN